MDYIKGGILLCFCDLPWQTQPVLHCGKWKNLANAHGHKLHSVPIQFFDAQAGNLWSKYNDIVSQLCKLPSQTRSIFPGAARHIWRKLKRDKSNSHMALLLALRSSPTRFHYFLRKVLPHKLSPNCIYFSQALASRYVKSESSLPTASRRGSSTLWCPAPTRAAGRSSRSF